MFNFLVLDLKAGHSFMSVAPENPDTTTDGCDDNFYDGLVRSLGIAPSTRGWNVQEIVLSITKRATDGISRETSVIRIVESLVWPFVCRLSNKQQPNAKWVSGMVRSFRTTACNVAEHLSPDNREQQYAKYWLDLLLGQAFLDVEVPAKKDWIIKPLFSGLAYRLLKKYLIKRDIALIYSLSKGSKLAWPSLGDIRREEALEKNRVALTTPTHYTIDFRLLSESIRKFSVRVFSPIVHHGATVGTKMLPSGSACFQSKQKVGGAKALFTPFMFPEEDTSRQLGSLRSLIHSGVEWRYDTFNAAYDAAVKTLRPQLGRKKILSRIRIVAIAEPAKFRIISAGDGYVYTALQPLQGQMISAWKKRRESTMSLIDITPRIQEMVDALPTEQGYEFISGDYESATDLISRGASLSAFLGIDHSHPLFELGFESLGDVIAQYPHKSGEFKVIGGQLMGHPLSFPLLCVINAAMYHHTVDEVYGSGGLSPSRVVCETMHKHVLVNGDDILFRSSRSFANRFFDNTRKVGLIPSAGKNYYSRLAGMINSQVFVVSDSDRVTRVGYLNQRLMYGSNVKKGRSEALPTSIGPELSKMADLTPWTSGCIDFAMSRFPHRGFGYTPNWYLPVHLGGYGVGIQHASRGTRITRTQRLVAAKFLREPRLCLFRLAGDDFAFANTAGALANWRMVYGEYVAQEHESFENSDAWLNRLMYYHEAATMPQVGNIGRAIAQFVNSRDNLTPMSFEGMASKWTARLVATGLPMCPPQSELRINLRTEFKARNVGMSSSSQAAEA